MEVREDIDTASGFKQGGGRHPQTSATEWSRISSRLFWQFLRWVCFMAFCVAGEGSDTCALYPPAAHQTACPVELEEGLRPPNNPYHQAVGALL